MIRKVPLSVSCDTDLLTRLNNVVDAQRRSQFVCDAIKKALDEIEMETLRKEKHKAWVLEKVVPMLKKHLKGVGYDELKDLWYGSPEGRKYLIAELKITLSDESLKMALNEVMKDYE